VLKTPTCSVVVLPEIYKCRTRECQNMITDKTGIIIDDNTRICLECKKNRKVCGLCGATLLRTQFSPNPQTRDRLHRQCKQCRALLKRGYSAELIRNNWLRLDEDGEQQTHRHDLCDTELATGQPIAGDDCFCQLCWDSRTGKLLS